MLCVYLLCLIKNECCVGMRIFPETLKLSETFRINIPKKDRKHSEIFRSIGLVHGSSNLKTPCIDDRSRKECTFTLCSYPDLFAPISRGMKYPSITCKPRPYEAHF